MKSLPSFARFALRFLPLCLFHTLDASPLPRVQADWSNARLGGGGYITGLLPDPKIPGRLWARCDVAGLFLSEDGGRSFRPMNRGLTASSHHSVESFALSPHDSQLLFRCSGEARAGKSFGYIHGTRDGGKTWQLLTAEPDFIGNGETRNFGEMIAVDPFDPELVVAASFSKGVFVSRDTGKTWTCSGLQDEPLKALAFHPRLPRRLYLGTLQTLGHKDYLRPEGYARPSLGRLYLSEDAGLTWKLLYEGSEIAFHELQFAPDEDETLYVAGGSKGLFKSEDGGKSFRPLSRGLPAVAFNSLAVDPRDPQRLYTAACVGPKAPVPVVPLYVSRDGGEHWEPLKDYRPGDFTEYPTPREDLRPIGWAIAKIRIDPFDSQTLYMSNWFGVSVSQDGGQHWSGNHYKGIENVCVETVVAHPTKRGWFYFAAADRTIARSTDGGLSYSSFAEHYLPTNYYCSTALAPSARLEGLVVFGVTNNGSRSSAFYRAEANGDRVGCSLELPQGLMVQSLREDAADDGVFWASVDGPLAKGAGLYTSRDEGRTWQRLPQGGLPLALETLPAEPNWVENELLSVVWYQTKNACGTNQLLAMQPVRPGAFYWGEWTRGLWRTDDGAKTWTEVSRGLPFGRAKPTTLVALSTDPAKPDRLYAGFIGEGLWRSEDRGATWSKLHPLEGEAFNASSIAIGGERGEQLFVSCEPLGLSPCLPSLRLSCDDGKTWSECYDPAQGALRLKSLALDRKTGVLQAGTCGNGVFRVLLPRP